MPEQTHPTPVLPYARRAAPPAPPTGYLLAALATFGLGGNLRNAGILAATAAGTGVLFALQFLPFHRFMIFGGIVGLVLGFIAVAYAARFFWSVLCDAARGECELSLVAEHTDYWEDAIKPIAWLLIVSCVCFGPAAWLYYTGQPAAVVWLAGLGGAALWPAALLAALFGDSIVSLRPDRLVRGILGFGWVYWPACGLVYATLGAWVQYMLWLRLLGMTSALAAALLGWVAGFYFGYVAFHNLGLLYHYRGRRTGWGFE